MSYWHAECLVYLAKSVIGSGVALPRLNGLERNWGREMLGYRMVIYDEDDKTVVVDRFFPSKDDRSAEQAVSRIRRGRRACLERAGQIARKWESEPTEFVGSNVVPLARITSGGPWSPYRPTS